MIYKKFAIQLSAVVLVLASVLLSGCAAGGSSFVEVEPSQSGQGRVVFYRPRAFVGGAVSVALADNGEEIARIKNGQYLVRDTDPGAHQFRTLTGNIDKAVDVDVEAGKLYYLSLSLRQGMWVNSWVLTRVYDDQAIVELKACCKDGESP